MPYPCASELVAAGGPWEKVQTTSQTCPTRAKDAGLLMQQLPFITGQGPLLGVSPPSSPLSCLSPEHAFRHRASGAAVIGAPDRSAPNVVLTAFATPSTPRGLPGLWGSLYSTSCVTCLFRAFLLLPPVNVALRRDISFLGLLLFSCLPLPTNPL